jgi:hypothetical protein
MARVLYVNAVEIAFALTLLAVGSRPYLAPTRGPPLPFIALLDILKHPLCLYDVVMVHDVT